MCAFNPSMPVMKTEKLWDYGQFTLMSLCPHIHAYVLHVDLYLYVYMQVFIYVHIYV